MATRAIVQASNLITQRYLVPATKAATKGLAVIFSGADDQVENAGADSDLAIGVALNTAAAGEYVDVALFAYAVVEATCGTGGTTRGKKQVLVSDGFTDAPADNGATTPKPTYGFALQSAVAADKFGLALSGPANRTTT
jgi:hypothetical protein